MDGATLCDMSATAQRLDLFLTAHKIGLYRNYLSMKDMQFEERLRILAHFPNVRVLSFIFRWNVSYDMSNLTPDSILRLDLYFSKDCMRSRMKSPFDQITIESFHNTLRLFRFKYIKLFDFKLSGRDCDDN